MRYISWPIYFFVFVFLVTFSLQNTQTASLYYYLGLAWTAPSYLINLTLLFIGIFIGILSSLGVIIKQKKRIMQLQKNNQSTLT